MLGTSETAKHDTAGGGSRVASMNLDEVVAALVAAITTGVLADAPVGILAITVADFTIAAANQLFARRAGLTGDVTGRPFGEVFPAHIRTELEELARCLATGEVAAASIRCSAVAGEASALGRFVAVRDENGRAGLLLAYCDPAGCDLAGCDPALAPGECGRFEWEEVAAVTARPGDTPLVLVADASWRIRSWCPAAEAELGRTAEALLGTRVADLVHPDDLPVLVAALAEVTSLDRSHAPLPLRLQRADGTWAETSTAATPMSRDGELAVALVVFAEGTAVQTEVGHRLAELERSVNRLLEEFERSRPAARNPVIAALEQLPGAGLLSGREREVLELVAEGYRVSTIARELFVSPSTIRNHLSSIFRKLGVGSQAELLERLRSVAGSGAAQPV